MTKVQIMNDFNFVKKKAINLLLYMKENTTWCEQNFGKNYVPQILSMHDPNTFILIQIETNRFDTVR